MSHSIEHIDGLWQRSFHRHPIDGKRRIMVWASQLKRLLSDQTNHADWILSIQTSPLRNEIDYHLAPNRNDIRLTISAVQALLVMQNTPHSWQLHHALSDLIHRGFSNTEGRKTHAQHH